MNRPSELFNAEERDLAERLARLGGPREPAPGLDARILAMAREAIARDAMAQPPTAAAPSSTDPKVTPLRPRKPTPRWPLGMGLAASLVLAAGIGWRMHGDGNGLSEDAPMAAAADAAADASYEVESSDSIVIGPPLPRQNTPAPAAPPPMSSAADAMAPSLARKSIDQVEGARTVAGAPPVIAPPSAAPALNYNALAAEQAAPAPPALEAIVTRNAESEGRIEITGDRIPRTEVRSDREVGAAEFTRTPLDQRRDQQTATRAKVQEAPPPPPAPASANLNERNRARNTLSGGALASQVEADKKQEVSDLLYDERPPVTADSLEFRQAWLQRIRDLIAKGDETAAGESLQEFRRRYPGTELPEDLRKLAATLPPPTP